MVHQKKITSQRVVLVSFLVDVSDVILNLVATILSGSVVMLAQVLEGAADLVSSGLLLIGLKRAQRPPDVKHPFGYGRELYFWTMLSAIVMFAITATLSFYYGLQRFLHPEPISNLPLAFLVLSFAIITNGYSLSLSLRRLVVRRRSKNLIALFLHSSLIATKTTLILDLMGTVASILGLISLVTFQLTGDLRYDGIGAMLIGIMLGFLALVNLVGVKDLLVGASAPADIQEKIKQIALSFDQVIGIIGIRTVYIGLEKLLVNIEVDLGPKLTTRQIEKLIDDIEAKLKQKIPEVSQVFLELESPAAPARQ